MSSITFMMKRFFFIVTFMTLAACSSRNTVTTSRSPSLYSTWWRVVEVDGRQQDFLAGQKMDVFITLSVQGRLNASGGCNNIGGSFVRSGSSIGFSPKVATRIACPPVVLSRERLFVDALRKASSFLIENRELRLLDRSGNEVLKCIAVRRP